MLPLQAVPGQFGPMIRSMGLQVWRVEKMKAAPLEQTEVGSFYNGDSYLVLDNRGEMGADIHMWIGESGKRFYDFRWKIKRVQIKSKWWLTLKPRSCTRGIAADRSGMHQRFLFDSCQSANSCPPLTLLHAHRWPCAASEWLIIDPSPVTHETRH